MWYPFRLTLSHNCLLNFVVGPRGGGKTYTSLRDSTIDYLRGKGKFVYLRRYKNELDDFYKQFDTVSKDKLKFKDHEKTVTLNDYLIKVKGRKAYILKRTDNIEKDEKNIFKEENIFCMALVLSQNVSKKSSDYNDVTKMIFDEFILEKGAVHYLPNEPSKLLGIMETVGRMRENFTVICLGNSVTVYNPYFMFFNIKPPKKEFTKYKNGTILVHYFADLDYIKAKKSTRFGKLIEGTEAEAYMVDNEFTSDSEEFIKQKSSEALHLCSFDFNGYHMGMWVDYNLGDVYITEKVGKNDSVVYAITREDQRPNIILLKSHKNNYHFKLFKTAVESGTLYFSSGKVKALCNDLINYMNI